MRPTQTQVQTSPSGTHSRSYESPVYRLQFGITLALALITAAAFLIYLLAALNWRSQPYLGALLDNGLRVNRARPTAETMWYGLTSGLRPGDTIVSINGVPLMTTPGDFAGGRAVLNQIRASLTPGSSAVVEYLTPGSDRLRTAAFPINGGFPESDFFVYFLIPYLSGVVVVLMGAAILRFKRHQLEGLAAASACFLMALFMGGIFDAGTTYLMTRLWLLSAVMLGGTLVLLSMVFPIRALFTYQDARVLLVPQALSLIIGLVIILLYDRGEFGNFGISSSLSIGVLLLCTALLSAVMYQRYRKAVTRTIYDQSSVLLVGVLLAMSPGILWGVTQLLRLQSSLVPLEAMMPFLIMPVFGITVAIFHSRRLDTDFVFSRGVTYFIMMMALVGGYFLLVLGISLFAGRLMPANNPTLIAFTLFIIAVLFIPVRTALQNRIDNIYYKRRINYQAKSEQFARDISGLSGSNVGIPVGLFRQTLEESLAPEKVFVLLPNTRGSGEYVAYGDPRPETDIIFQPESGVVDLLRIDPGLHYLDPEQPLRAELLIDRARLGILKTTVLAGLLSNNALIGIVSIGQSRSGRQYTHEELRFMDGLLRQLTIAVERAQSFDSLERRVRELDVLSQVGQAVNFTIEFDDLLELISTRTSRLLDSPHFFIALHESASDQMYFAFYLENDERYTERENVRWKFGSDLFSDIVRSNQPRRIDDYARTIAQSGYEGVLDAKQVHAWMGVPLIAGANTLGTMAVGKLRTNETYTADQLRIFNNIGALAATSLDKARLYTEANIRARQLTALNEISQQLVVAEAGEVETLLKLITESAVQILNAEAGSLLLASDDDSGDMIFRVAIGGASDELVGRRVKAGFGLVGEVAKTSKPIITNDTRRDDRWKGEVAKTGEFHTTSILAVPLTAKDRNIGVLEVLNKKDGTVFVKEDTELLTTFAGQAAIAIENARLFQMTGSQLNKRLEELETLERIDFELNRTLDIQRVAEITVRWTVASSGAVAGALGLVEGAPPYLRILATYGYKADEHPAGADDKRWPLDKGIVKRVLRTLQPDLADTRIDPDYVPSLKGTISQITLPMLSGGELNAILILETNKEPRFNLLDLSFVQRIAEHASIAVANALLLQQLQFAAETKSEFVAFAAHELKNPLASVIGYADVLKAEMAGPMNDMQKQFVGVIRSNADRIQSIIDDLRDVAALDANKLKMELHPMYFNKVVEDTLITFEQRLLEKNQTINNQVNSNLPLVMGDHKRLVQVMTNLVSNANKYSPEDSTITIAAEVNPNFRTRQGELLGPVLHVRVKDQGIGMDEKDLARIFREDYFRSDNEKAREQKGTGLGMMITQRFVEGHGGKIWVESQINSGSTFHFVVPLAPAEPAERPTDPAVASNTDSAVDDAHRAPTQMRPSAKTEPHLRKPDELKQSQPTQAAPQSHEPASD